MDYKLIILLGFGESGKTTYAKSTGLKVISFDSYEPYGSKERFENKLIRIAEHINNLNEDCILDGYVYMLKGEILDPYFKILKSKLKKHKIILKPIIRNIDDIIKAVLNRTDLNNKSPDKVDKDFVTKSYVAIICMLKEQEQESINGTFYDKAYQTLDIPYLSYKGYNKYDEDTWNRIKNLIDWKGKKVADIGCLDGWYCFNILDSGAEFVTGYDLFETACEIANIVSHIKFKETRCNFKQIDIGKDSLKEKYDVILCLNTLHHVVDPIHAINEIFKNCNEALFEIQFGKFVSWMHIGHERMNKNSTIIPKEVLLDIAKKHDFELVVEFDGRPGEYEPKLKETDCTYILKNSRKIMYFKKCQNIK